MNSKRILVLGDGGWGTALALVLHHNGHNVTLWSKFPEYAQYVNKKRENTKFLPGVKLPRTLKVISELIIQNSDLIVMAVPTQFCRSVLKDLRSTLGVYTERSECARRFTLYEFIHLSPGFFHDLKSNLATDYLAGMTHHGKGLDVAQDIVDQLGNLLHLRRAHA